MCGIFIWTASHPDDDATARNAFETIAHRGPDNSTFHKITPTKAETSSEDEGDGVLFWGCHRLAVVDPDNEAANQPIWHQDHGIVCNGQIYNHRALLSFLCPSSEEDDDVETAHDVTALLEAFVASHRERTIDADSVASFFRLVDGDFACALLTPSFDVKGGRKVVLVRDPLGIRPLFWLKDRTSGRLVAAASEAKALLPLLRRERERRVSGNFDDIVLEDFPPGCVYCDGKIVEFDRPYDRKTVGKDDVRYDMADVAKTLVQPFRDAVIKRLRQTTDGRGYVGVLLSGGLDSSLIACAAHEYLSSIGRGHELRTYSVSFEGRGVDAEHARMLAEKMGIDKNHTEVRFDVDDALDVIDDVVRACETADAPTIRAGIPMYILARHIRNASPHKVILSGEGSDELFMGYPYFSNSPSVEEDVEESSRLLRNIHAFDVLRADRCMAAHNLELRVPFLDRDLVRHVLRRKGVPKRFLSPAENGGVEKALLRTAFRNVYPALASTRIIDRMKEKMSHGCGLDYVPALLRNIPGRDEETYYSAAFDRVFSSVLGTTTPISSADITWTVPRTMPSWASQAPPSYRGRRGSAAISREGEEWTVCFETDDPPTDAGDWSRHAKPDPSSLTEEQMRQREEDNKQHLDAKLQALLLEREQVWADTST